MVSSKGKEATRQNLAAFCQAYPVVYYWTFTFAERLTDKDEADRRLKPLVDLIRRRGGELIGVWEFQRRQSWHVHLLTNVFLDVTWLRPWMVERAWGPQMKVKRLDSPRQWVDGQGWIRDEREQQRTIDYLTKYLTKDLQTDSAFYKKLVFCSSGARKWNTKFKFAPWVRPFAYLFAMGLPLFLQLEQDRLCEMSEAAQRRAVFLNTWSIIRIGYEDSGWASVDPWLFPV